MECIINGTGVMAQGSLVTFPLALPSTPSVDLSCR